MEVFNQDRFHIAAQHFLQTNNVLSVPLTNLKEPVVYRMLPLLLFMSDVLYWIWRAAVDKKVVYLCVSSLDHFGIVFFLTALKRILTVKVGTSLLSCTQRLFAGVTGSKNCCLMLD
jgi:hypothetical protein